MLCCMQLLIVAKARHVKNVVKGNLHSLAICYKRNANIPHASSMNNLIVAHPNWDVSNVFKI